MRNLIYNKLWPKSVVGLILVGLFLSACNGGVDSQTTPATPTMVSIDATATVPVFAGTSTTSVIYVHNNSDMPISNIKYSIQDNSGQNNPDTNQFMLTTSSCSVIAAHGSCSLGFTTPILKAKSAQGSAIITAKYPHGYFKQIINYAQVQNGSRPGVYGSDATIHSYGNASGYATVYLYAGGQNQSYKLQNFSSNNTSITINQPSSNSLTSGQVVAVEVSTKSINSLTNNQVSNMKTATMHVNYTNLATQTTGTTLVGLTVAPISNGPVLTSGSVPIIDVQTSVNGQLLVVNSGNSAANISAITPPSGVSLGSGSNACSTSIPLAAGASCTVYFSVSQAGGSNAVTIAYDNGDTLSQNITWYNPVGGALLQMTASPSTLSFNSGFSATVGRQTTVTVTNIGGYDLTGISIPAESNTNGGHATATTSTALACQNSSGVSTGTTLPVGGLCTYAITLADTVAESNMNMLLFIAGNYTNSSGSQIYQRGVNISYTVNPVYGTATLSLNPTSIAVNGTSTATITVTGASSSAGTQTFNIASSNTGVATVSPSSCSINLSSSNTCSVTVSGVAVGSTNISATNAQYTISPVVVVINPIIFITAGTYTGDLKDGGGGIYSTPGTTGEAGADAICQGEAYVAGSLIPSGLTFKGLIVTNNRYPCDSTGNCGDTHSSDWPLSSNAQYVNSDLTTFNTVNSNLVFDGSNPNIKQANGTAGSGYFWSGIQSIKSNSTANDIMAWGYADANPSTDGTMYSQAAPTNCSNYTSTSFINNYVGGGSSAGHIGDIARVGFGTISANTWGTWYYFNNTSSSTLDNVWNVSGFNVLACNSSYKLVCVQK